MSINDDNKDPLPPPPSPPQKIPQHICKTLEDGVFELNPKTRKRLEKWEPTTDKLP